MIVSYAEEPNRLVALIDKRKKSDPRDYRRLDPVSSYLRALHDYLQGSLKEVVLTVQGVEMCLKILLELDSPLPIVDWYFYFLFKVNLFYNYTIIRVQVFE